MLDLVNLSVVEQLTGIVLGLCLGQCITRFRQSQHLDSKQLTFVTWRILFWVQSRINAVANFFDQSLHKTRILLGSGPPNAVKKYRGLAIRTFGRKGGHRQTHLCRIYLDHTDLVAAIQNLSLNLMQSVYGLHVLFLNSKNLHPLRIAPLDCSLPNLLLHLGHCRSKLDCREG